MQTNEEIHLQFVL
jgi:hypothetical protein